MLSEDIRQLFVVAKWEVKRSFYSKGKEILPVAAVLFILLVIVTGYASQSGFHIQDSMYVIGVSDEYTGNIFVGDDRFVIYKVNVLNPSAFLEQRKEIDALIIDGWVYAQNSEMGRAALKALSRDYDQFIAGFYGSQEDLFAAYPLWIDVVDLKSEIDFAATASGSRLTLTGVSDSPPVPQKPVEPVEPPKTVTGIEEEVLREQLYADPSEGSTIGRYTQVLDQGEVGLEYYTPSRLSPPLPFDTIVLVFVFVFPLYFSSQFFMMSIMKERIERKGETLLSAPIRPTILVMGKSLPYFGAMTVVSLAIIIAGGFPLMIFFPLIPVICFFLANALIIGMVGRSFKELSFLSIFFSTVATSYIFFPSIFANIHVVSLISPLTLVVLEIQGTGFSLFDYFYSGSLFFLTSIALFAAGIANFNSERLFSQHRLLTRIRECISGLISYRHIYISLFFIALVSIPFVFMGQMMALVLFFNLPMPFSLLLLIFAAALIEETAKSIGFYSAAGSNPQVLNYRIMILGSLVIAAGFLLGEKMMLFATLSQISDSIFGNILFLSLSSLWLPFVLHFVTVLIVASMIKIGGRRGFLPGLLIASMVHMGYNIYFISGGTI